MYKILITDELPEAALELLKKDNQFTFRMQTNLTNQQLCSGIRDYHALIVRSATKVTKQVLDSAKNLKVVGRAGTGLDNINVGHAKKKGIAVFNTPGSNAQAVAELTIGLLFTLTRKIYPAVHSLKNKQWQKSALVGRELGDKVLGLIGFGRIAQKVGHMASALGMQILVFKQNPLTVSPGYPFELASLEKVLKKSDFVSLHIPLNERTKNFITSKQLKMMKADAYLINTSRGGILKEKDLLEAVEQGIIGGAALDVYEQEPPLDFQLIQHPKILCTPHIGASSTESQERVGIDIVNSVMDYLKTNYLFI